MLEDRKSGLESLWVRSRLPPRPTYHRSQIDGSYRYRSVPCILSSPSLEEAHPRYREMTHVRHVCPGRKRTSVTTSEVMPPKPLSTPRPTHSAAGSGRCRGGSRPSRHPLGSARLSAPPADGSAGYPPRGRRFGSPVPAAVIVVAEGSKGNTYAPGRRDEEGRVSPALSGVLAWTVP